MKFEKKNYQPISCALYDELTLLILRKQKVKIAYKEVGGEVLEVETIIEDVYSKEGEEFILLKNEETIRLDRLLKVDNKDFIGKC